MTDDGSTERADIRPQANEAEWEQIDNDLTGDHPSTDDLLIAARLRAAFGSEPIARADDAERLAQRLAQRLGKALDELAYENTASRLSNGSAQRNMTVLRLPQISQRRSAIRWAIGTGTVVLLGWGIRGEIRPPEARDQRFSTPAATQSTVTLIDGTRIVLAPQTMLTVSGDFGRGTRTVMLTGEARFDVKTATGNPFVVRTGAVSTRVLGTTFAIRHYTDDTVVQIAVSSGKVEAHGRGIPVTVTTGAMAQVTDSTATVTAAGDVRAYTDWTTGRLVFDRTPVPTMLATLGRWYGYDFQLKDSTLVSRNVSAVFNISDPTDMMIVLKGTLGVNMTFNGKVVTLQPRQSRSRAFPNKDVFKSSLEMGR